MVLWAVAWATVQGIDSNPENCWNTLSSWVPITRHSAPRWKTSLFGSQVAGSLQHCQKNSCPGCNMLLDMYCEPAVLLEVTPPHQNLRGPCSRSCCKCCSLMEPMSIGSPLRWNGCMAHGLTCGEWMSFLAWKSVKIHHSHSCS